jgi:hypothetical protein
MALRGMPSNLAESTAWMKAAPAFSLMARQAQRAVAAHPGKDDGDAGRLLVLGERAEEKIDGQVQAPGRDLRQQVERPVQQRHVLAGGDHVDVVRLHGDAVLGLRHGHARRALEQLDEHPLVRRIEVLHDDEGHVRLARHVLEEELERLQAAGRGADADDRKRAARTGDGGLPDPLGRR